MSGGNYMKHTTIALIFIVMATLLSPVHAQEVTSDATPSAETTNETSSTAETAAPNDDAANEKENEKQNESEKNIEVNQNNESKSAETIDAKQNMEISDTIAIDAASVTTTAEVVIESGRKHRTPKTDSAGISDPCSVPGGCTPVASLPAAPAPCVVSDTIGCPIDPCLAADSVLCQPQPEPPVQPEEDSSEEETAPLFSFNPLWVVGPVKPSNPSAGTLVTTPIPIELTETGPNPYIIGQADGRSAPVEVFSPAPEATTASLTGLFTSANLPWLGLLVLLVLGIFAWRGREE